MAEEKVYPGLIGEAQRLDMKAKLLKIDEIMMEELDDVSGLSVAIDRIRREVFGDE